MSNTKNKIKITKIILPLLTLVFFFSVSNIAKASDAALIPDTETFHRGLVTKASETVVTSLPGLDTHTKIQDITVKILDGEEAGASIQIKNDYTQVKAGETIYLRHTTNSLDGRDIWVVSDIYRLNYIIYLSLIFLVLVIVFGGIQGIRGILSLIGSIGLIFYALIPGIYYGLNPVLVSVAVSSLIIILGSYITHGFNKTTTSAVLGMIVTVFITGALAYYTVILAKLSGHTSEETTYLFMDKKGSVDLVGILFSGIIIGLLGVLYDIAIGQAVAIEELFRAGKHMTKSKVYTRGIRIGREHIGALVNTLAIAYVGASLPIFLLVQSSTQSISFIANSEIFATEIVRILIGSIGLVLAVPITTFISCIMLEKIDKSSPSKHHHHHH